MAVKHALALVFLVACKGATVREEPPRPADTPPAPSAAPVASVGAPCEPGTLPGRVDPCGTKQRVAFVMNERTPDFAVPPPCTIPPPPISWKLISSSDLGWCFADGRIHVRDACFECRVPGAGWSAVGQLDEMTEAQARALQKKLSMPDATALTGEAAWRAALAKKYPFDQADASTRRGDEADAGFVRGKR